VAAERPQAAALPQSLTHIYAQYFDFVWTNARRLGVAESSADDVVQDVFMVVHRRLPDYDGRASLRAWIFGILLRVVRDHRRSFRRKAARWLPIEREDAHAPASEEPTPAELAERAEHAQLLAALLDRLSDEQRSVLILAVLEQWTLREIGESLGVNPNTVHTRLRAAKRALGVLYREQRAGKGAQP
jgi:RNA polymerase sigma-70 factor (ECF subfamily)